MAPQGLSDTGETVFSFHPLSHGLKIAAVPDGSEMLFLNVAQQTDFFLNPLELSHITTLVTWKENSDLTDLVSVHHL